MIIKDASESEATAHVTDGHGTGIDHAGQFKQGERAWLALFIDLSIMQACTAAAHGHVDSPSATRPRPLCIRDSGIGLTPDLQLGTRHSRAVTGRAVATSPSAMREREVFLPFGVTLAAPPL